MLESHAETKIETKKPLSLWRNRDYLLLIGGRVVSNLGTQVSTLAFPLFILALTGSPALAGFAGALHAAPYLLLSLPAGALVDRWDRKRVMLLCDAGRALCLASIPLAYAFGLLTIWQLYLVSLVEGTLFVFFNLAETACLPRVVTKDQLSTAAAQNMALDSVGFTLGPALGGALYTFGRVVPFLTDAISYIASVISLLFIKKDFQGERSAEQRSLLVEIREGLSWLWHAPVIRFMAFMGSTIHVTGIGMTIIVILMAQQLHTPTAFIGLILAMDGIGTVLGAALGERIYRRFSFPRIVITTTWLWAIIWPLLAFVPNAALLGAILGMLFLVLTVFDVAQFSYRLTLIPDELQGRVNSVYRLVLFAGDALGLFLVGILLQALGPAKTILLYGACIVLVAIITTLSPSLRKARVKSAA